MKVVNTSRRDWSVKLHESLWAYRTAYKSILGVSPYHLVYGKACHLPVEVQYKAWWAIKTLNMDLNRVGMKRFLDLNEMEELRNDAYINSNIAKQRLKREFQTEEKQGILQHQKSLAKILQHQIPNAKILQHLKFTCRKFSQGLPTISQPVFTLQTHVKCQRFLYEIPTIRRKAKAHRHLAKQFPHHSTPRGHQEEEETSASRPFLAMARIRGGHTEPSTSHEDRPSSSTPQDSSQAPTIPFLRDLSPRETSKHAQPDSQGPANSQHPFDITPEAIIKRPMGMRQQLDLWDSFELLQRYHLERLMTPREFFYPRVAMEFYQSMTTQGAQSPIAIHFSIDGRQGILEARHIIEALHIPFQPEDLAYFRQWSPISQRDMVRILSRWISRDSFLLCKEFPIWDAPRYLRAFYTGPYHLIMDAFLYFEEKVHRKKLQRADTIPLLFPRLLCHILEHIGYPTEPYLERHHHCREHFTLDQWTQLAGKNLMESAPEAAPPRPASLAAFTDLPATPPIPPTTPPTSEDFITVSGMEFCAMINLFKTLTAMHNALFQHMTDIRAQQDQHTAILRQIQQHLGLPPPQTDILGPSEPRAPAEETIIADVLPQASHEAATEPLIHAQLANAQLPCTSNFARWSSNFARCEIVPQLDAVVYRRPYLPHVSSNRTRFEALDS
ncbi:hypothetical protein CK203_106152 [Vitis vinifera]|uniref:Uncharacterized protein n=1 Tax=Vitis vinifera TaxID=29760 RepID=A0A438C4L7_VITVI|nr:hypothetical protein CK203_106152 [Vitis vinifera]